MVVDFSFFERSLEEKRIYRVRREWERDLLRDLAEQGGVDILDDTDDYTLVRAANLMKPGAPRGARPVEERFGVKLPREVHEFYRRWNGGVLIYRDLYRLLSVRAIMDAAMAFREHYRVPMDLPWHLLRFCYMGHSHSVALRRKSDAHWEVICAGIDTADPELLCPTDPDGDARRVLDASFLAWLRRMDETDGWPWGEHIMLPHDKPPCERVW